MVSKTHGAVRDFHRHPVLSTSVGEPRRGEGMVRFVSGRGGRPADVYARLLDRPVQPTGRSLVCDRGVTGGRIPSAGRLSLAPKAVVGVWIRILALAFFVALALELASVLWSLYRVPPARHRLPKGGLVALSLRACPGCAREVHVVADVCRHCGGPLEVGPELVDRAIIA